MSKLKEFEQAKKKKLKQLKKEAEKDLEKILKAQEEEVEEVEDLVDKEKFILQKSAQKRGLFMIEKYANEVTNIDKKLSTIQTEIEKLESSKVLFEDSDEVNKKIKSLLNKSEALKKKKDDLLNYIKKLDEARLGKEEVDVQKETLEILKYKNLIKDLEKTIRNIEKSIDKLEDEDDINELKEKKEKYIQKKEEYLELIQSLQETREGLLQSDEQLVLKLVKEIIKMRDLALQENKKLSVDSIIKKLIEFNDSDVLSDEAKDIFELLFKFKKTQLISFLNLYLKKNIPFFEFLPEYYNKIMSRNKEDLNKLDKDELLKLIKDSKFKGDYQNKNKSYLIEILLKKRCDPELDILCASDEVCDIEKEVCIPKPDKMKEKYGIKMYKGTYLYGPYSTLKIYHQRLMDMMKLERQRIQAMDIKNKIKTNFEKEIEKKTTKFLDIAGKEIEPSKKGYIPKFSQTISFYSNMICLNDYSNKPWINNYSKDSTYIVNADGSKPNIKYIVSNDQLEYKDNTYYKANRVFNLLNCNKYQKDRKQDEDILTIYDENGSELRFKLLHKLNNGQFLKQTEDMFEIEKKWILLYNQSVLEKLNFYLGYQFNNNSLNGIIRTKVLNVLENLLLQNYIFNEIEKNIRELYPNFNDKTILSLTYDVFRGIATKEKVEQKIDLEQIKSDVMNRYKNDSIRIASEIETNIRNSINDDDTVGDYLRKVSDIIIYFDNNLKLFQISRTFVNKVLNHFYKNSFLENIKVEDKLSEIFKNPNIDEDTKIKLIQIIGSEIENKTFEIMSIVLNMLEPTAKSINTERFLKPVSYQGVLDLVPIQPSNLKEGSSWEFEYYIEDGKIFAFNIFTLLDNFLNKNYKNPVSGKDLEESFVQDILSKYSLSNILFGDEIDPSDEYILIKEDLDKKEDVTKIVYDLLERAISEDERSDRVEDIFEVNEDIEEINLDDDVDDVEPEEVDEPEEVEEVEEEFVENEEDSLKLLQSFYRFLKTYFEFENKEIDYQNFIQNRTKDNEILVQFFNYLEQNYYPDIGYVDSTEIIDKFIDNQIGESKIKDEELCDYCKKRLSDEVFKSAVKKSQGSEIVKFCSLKCMEDSPFRKRT